MDGLEASRQGPEGGLKNPERLKPNWDDPRLSPAALWTPGISHSWKSGPPACLASCPAWARHSPTDTPAESAPACLGTLLAHLLPASCTAGHGMGGLLGPQLVLVRLAPPLGGW